MILQSLVRLYETLQEQGRIVSEGWSPAKVTDAIQLDRQGQFLGVISVRKNETRGKKEVEIPSVMTVPLQHKKTVNVCANFLCDSSSYFLCMDNKGKPKRTEDCFLSAKALHHAVLDGCSDPYAKALLNFFDTWNAEKAETDLTAAENQDEIIQAGSMVFQIEGQYLHKRQAFIKAWNDYLQKENSSGNMAQGQCLVTGEQDQPIALLHPSIKGVRGAQSSGASLVSFNAPAYESYGNEGGQGLNAPVSEYAAFAYGAALNALLADREHTQLIGDATTVYWSEHAQTVCQDLVSSAINGMDNSMDEETLDNVIRHMRDGTALDIQGIVVRPDEPFYILGLAPNAARLSVRFFLRSTFGQTLLHLSEHQKRMEIIRPSWEKRSMIPLWLLLKKTANSHSQDNAASPLMAGSLFRAILADQPYPEALFQNLMLRIFSEQDEYNEKGTRISEKIGSVRAAGLKAYLLKNHSNRWEGKITMNVNDNCRDMAYVLGRLFSVLENVQQNANPGINATIKDRYFNSACATPASVFPILLKLANSHLAKIDTPFQIAFNKKIGHLLSLIVMPDEGSPIPNRLSLEEQGAFVLGYYQETQDRYTKKGEKEND